MSQTIITMFLLRFCALIVVGHLLRQHPPVPAPRKLLPVSPLVPSSSPLFPLVPSSSALPERPREFALPERPREFALPERPREFALQERPREFVLPERPQQVAWPEHPLVPAPPERPRKSPLLQSAHQRGTSPRKFWGGAIYPLPGWPGPEPRPRSSLTQLGHLKK